MLNFLLMCFNHWFVVATILNSSNINHPGEKTLKSAELLQRFEMCAQVKFYSIDQHCHKKFQLIFIVNTSLTKAEIKKINPLTCISAFSPDFNMIWSSFIHSGCLCTNASCNSSSPIFLSCSVSCSLHCAGKLYRSRSDGRTYNRMI